ncbi:MAG: DsbA family protein, partial [Rhodospirillaceae bacterium]
FFNRELEIDEPDAVAGAIEHLGMDPAAYRDYLADQGPRDYEAALDEAMDDHVFGVPLFIYEGEQFWGHDRIWLLEKYLKDAGLAKEDAA